MSMTNYLETKILDHVYGATTYTPPTTIYYGLATAAASIEAGTVTEVSGTGYARVAVTNNATNFPSANPKLNGTAITFPTVGAGAWGTITHMVQYDASSGGNVLRVTALTTSRTPIAGDVVSFAIGADSLSLD